MSLHEMSRLWGVSFSKVHAAACKVRGGKLPKGRTKWSKEEQDAIKALIAKEE